MPQPPCDPITRFVRQCSKARGDSREKTTDLHCTDGAILNRIEVSREHLRGRAVGCYADHG